MADAIARLEAMENHWFAMKDRGGIMVGIDSLDHGQTYRGTGSTLADAAEAAMSSMAGKASNPANAEGE